MAQFIIDSHCTCTLLSIQHQLLPDPIESCPPFEMGTDPRTSMAGVPSHYPRDPENGSEINLEAPSLGKSRACRSQSRHVGMYHFHLTCPEHCCSWNNTSYCHWYWCPFTNLSYQGKLHKKEFQTVFAWKQWNDNTRTLAPKGAHSFALKNKPNLQGEK